MNDTVTRAQLSDAVYQEVGLSRKESADLVDFALKEIADALARGENVKISSFGSFFLRAKRKRVGRNPKTGEEVPIRPRKVVVFRASTCSRIASTLATGVNRESTASRAPFGGDLGRCHLHQRRCFAACRIQRRVPDSW